MALQHENRLGEMYFLQSGKTKTGKPHYYAGRKLTGTPLDDIPKGYEIHESPENGQVFLRKARPSAITPGEKQTLEEGIRAHSGFRYFIVDVEEDSLIVYLPGRDESEADKLAAVMVGSGRGLRSDRMEQARDALMKKPPYIKMMRLTLVDADERRFTVERWCFLGRIDNWVFVGGAMTLPEIVKKYAKHLGKNSFFDLM